LIVNVGNQKEHNMKTIKRMSALSVCLPAWLLMLPLLAFTSQAQVAGEKPGPKYEKLKVWEGDWTYEGFQHATPLGPEGKFKGTMTSRLILNGFALESDWVEDESGVTLGLAGKELHCYDPAKDEYVTYACDNSGIVSVFIDTFQGNIIIGRGTQTDTKGTKSMSRARCVFQPGGNEFTAKLELSTDKGKTWLPWYEMTAKKGKR